MGTYTLMASDSQEYRNTQHKAVRQMDSQMVPHPNGYTVPVWDTRTHSVAQSHFHTVLLCWLRVTARLTQYFFSWRGHEAGNVGDGAMRCGDTGRKMAAKAGLGHSEHSGPTTEDGPPASVTSTEGSGGR